MIMSDFAYRTITLKVPPNKSIDLEFENLSYKVNLGFRKGSKILLNGVSGKFQSGHLTGIMGPSGAGKSTLLNILSGLISENKNITGVIKYNGIESITRYDKQTCYILQDDQLNPFFTVCETMKIASDLKLGYILSTKAKEFLIEDILDMLGLCSCKDTKCENLSGGQRKRLSIALELIDNPPVMFLDEPTTGLDSLSSLQCIKLLKKLAEGGRNIVCTIHQPSASIFELFDQIYALANGECIYQGYSTNTVSYLATVGLQCPIYYNPADFLLDVASGEYGDYVPLLSNQNKTKISDIKSSPIKMIDNNNFESDKSFVLITKPSEITKFYVILKRMTVQIYRDWTITHLKVVLHFLIAIILGLLFQKCGNDGSKTLSNMGFLAGSVAYLSYTSLMPAVLKFPSELDILRKESFNNWYKLKTFYTAYLIANLPIQILCTIIYTSISYFLTSQIMDLQRFSMFLSISILLSLNAESHGLLFGSIVNPINGTFLAAITAAMMMLFCGYFVFLNHMPSMLYYLSFLSYMKYGLEALSISIYGFHRDTLDCPADIFYCHYRIPSMILNEIGYNQNSYWLNFSLLIVQFLFVRFITFFCLRRKISKF